MKPALFWKKLNVKIHTVDGDDNILLFHNYPQELWAIYKIKRSQRHLLTVKTFTQSQLILHKKCKPILSDGLHASRMPIKQNKIWTLMILKQNKLCILDCRYSVLQSPRNWSELYNSPYNHNPHLYITLFHNYFFPLPRKEYFFMNSKALLEKHTQNHIKMI